MKTRLSLEECEALQAFKDAIELVFDNGRWATVNNRMCWCVPEEAIEEIEKLIERFTR